MEEFFEDLKIIVCEYMKTSQKYPYLDKKLIEYKEAKKADICHICRGGYRETDERVVDHDHATEKILGAAHKLRNERRVNNRYIPIYAHNMSGYDAHFIIKNYIHWEKGI